MKLIYHPILVLFLLTTSVLYSHEFYLTHPIAKIELSNNCSQSNTHSLSGLNSRAKYLSHMIQRNVPQKTQKTTHSMSSKNHDQQKDTNMSRSTNYLSSSIKSERDKIRDRFIENDPEIHKYALKKYSISALSKKYLTFNNMDISTLESCQGNILQQTIHQEFLVLTDATAHIWNQSFCPKEVKDLTTVIGNFIDAGVSFNRTNQVKKACALADAGWALFDCILAAGEGAIEGISAVVHDITHPIQTAQNLAKTVISCGYYLGVALQEIDSITVALVSGNFDIAHNKYTQWQEHFKNITYALDECSQKLTSRDAIKTITSSLVQCYATTRAINGFSTLFKNAHQSAISIAKKVSDSVQEHAFFMSSEGVPLRIAQETLKQINNVPCARDKLLQALAQFESQKIQVGNVTLLLDKNRLKHILERHHPLYWNGTNATIQTFFDKKITISEIIDIIKQVVKQNRNTVLKKGNMGKYQVEAIIKNTRYIVGFDNGRIGQFYIPFKQ
jgi:hypothetical protein